MLITVDIPDVVVPDIAEAFIAQNAAATAGLTPMMAVQAVFMGWVRSTLMQYAEGKIRAQAKAQVEAVEEQVEVQISTRRAQIDAILAAYQEQQALVPSEPEPTEEGTA